ncbi:MAG: hypothetical protein GXY17_02720 [Clostridiaceae bacterium]|nr:hypothetical protein [Clostridiaceae bacterium]
MSRDELHAIDEWLLANHFMLKTKGLYPVLHSTYDGIHYAEKITVANLKNLKKQLDQK